MTNYEYIVRKFPEKVIEILSKNIAVFEDPELNIECCESAIHSGLCHECMFRNLKKGCIDEEEILKWLNAVCPYTDSKLAIPRDTPIDTKILVSIDGKYWKKRYFAGFSDDGLYVKAFTDGKSSWTGSKTYVYAYAKLPEV